jgi:hypothetical protein
LSAAGSVTYGHVDRLAEFPLLSLLIFESMFLQAAHKFLAIVPAYVVYRR